MADISLPAVLVEDTHPAPIELPAAIRRVLLVRPTFFEYLVRLNDRVGALYSAFLLCDSPEHPAAKKEYMFPFCRVVKCPQEKLLDAIGPTLVCSAITQDKKFQRQLLDATHIDRLNLGPIPTIKLNWLQPHEGSIVDFLFRARAFQFEGPLPA